MAEPYVDSENHQTLLSNKGVVVPANSFYLMGDNRDNSNDSRYFGPVPRKLIYGLLACKYYSAQ